MAVHLLLFAGYSVGKKYHVWEKLHLPSWVHPPKLLTDLMKKPEPLQPKLPDRPPLVFVDVSPAQASTEAPKNAPFYSDKNSRAANPDANKESNVPKITGKQKQVAKTEDVPREKFVPLQPARPSPQPQPEQPEVKAQKTQAPGDLALGKPAPKPQNDSGDAPHARPRTIQEAKARQQSQNRAPGEKMQQEGGVHRRFDISSFDAKATPFGAYDASLVDLIRERWYNLLDARDYTSDDRGRVVVQFHLHYDGRITDVAVAESTVNEVLSLICQKAIQDPSPFPAWPSDMRRLAGDVRSIQFTFYYN